MTSMIVDTYINNNLNVNRLITLSKILGFLNLLKNMNIHLICLGQEEVWKWKDKQHTYINQRKLCTVLLISVEQLYDDLQDLLVPKLLTPKKDVCFMTGDWDAKVGSQELLGITGKFSLRVQNEAVQRLTVLPRECIVIANPVFQQHKRQLDTWTSPDSQYQNQIGYILCSGRWRGSIQLAKTRQSWWWLRSCTPYCKIQT